MIKMFLAMLLSFLFKYIKGNPTHLYMSICILVEKKDFLILCVLQNCIVPLLAVFQTMPFSRYFTPQQAKSGY